MTEAIEKAFTYHPVKNAEQAKKYEDIRAFAKTFAHILVESVPTGYEMNNAINCLQEVVFWANAGIARNE